MRGSILQYSLLHRKLGTFPILLWITSVDKNYKEEEETFKRKKFHNSASLITRIFFCIVSTVISKIKKCMFRIHLNPMSV